MQFFILDIFTHEIFCCVGDTMTSTRIIAFTGKKRSGKTSAANYLIAHHGFTRISFADPLKYMLLELGVPRESLWGDEKEVPLAILGGKSGRYAMQSLGTEWGRQLISDDIWIAAWEKKVLACITAVVVDDVRFINESHLIHQLKGIVLLIERPDLENEDQHLSEIEISRLPCNGKLINDGSLKEFEANLGEWLEKLNQPLGEAHSGITEHGERCKG